MEISLQTPTNGSTPHEDNTILDASQIPPDQVKAELIQASEPVDDISTFDFHQTIPKDASLMEQKNIVLEFALAYAELGYYIFPAGTPYFDENGNSHGCTCEHYKRSEKNRQRLEKQGRLAEYDPNFKHDKPGKCPACYGNWKEKSSNDPDQIIQWFSKAHVEIDVETGKKEYQPKNIGLDCGKSGILIFDMDDYKDNYQGDSLALEEETIRTITQGGGSHVFYGPNDSNFGNHTKGLPSGIDIRGDGGYVILAPSIGASGGRYAFELDNAPNEIDLSPIPDDLHKLLQAAQDAAIKPADVSFSGAITPRHEIDILLKDVSDKWGKVIENGHPAGSDRSAIDYQICCALARAGFDADQILSTFEHYPIGEKFRESAANYRERTIAKAIGYVDSLNSTQDAQSAPKTNGKYVNGRFDYKDEDGGILDVWSGRYSNDWLYAKGWDAWHQWAATHWSKDETFTFEHAIERLCDELNDDARSEMDNALDEYRSLSALGDEVTKDDENRMAQLKEYEFSAIGKYIAATKRSKTRINSVSSMAIPRRAVNAANFDNGDSLNLKNGTLNLELMELTEHSRDDHFTYSLPYEYDPTALCPNFENYLASTIVAATDNDGWQSDMETIALLQELMGYSLTNDTRQEVMAWLYGEGGTGKSTLLKVLNHLLGVLAQSINFQTLATQGNYDLASVMGRRILFSSEAERGGKIVEGIIKQIVSGEPITARNIYESPITFEPIAKIWWAMNEKPIIKGTDDSIWRRMKVIPFLRQFSESDKDEDLGDKLLGELPGILNFALDGLKRLRENGKFTISPAVEKATAEYKHESNIVALWLEEFYTVQQEPVNGKAGIDVWYTSDMLYSSFDAWCTKNNRKPFSSTGFGKEIIKKAKDKDRRSDGQGCNGKKCTCYLLSIPNLLDTVG